MVLVEQLPGNHLHLPRLEVRFYTFPMILIHSSIFMKVKIII